MAIESLIGLIVFTIVFAAMGIYAKKHEARPWKRYRRPPE